MKLRSSHVKKIAVDLGVDLCGIASVDRFSDAPKGFHPDDMLPGCKSVVVIAVRFPLSTLSARSTIPYTIVRNELSERMDHISVRLCDMLESHGETAVPVGAIEPVDYDAQTDRYRGIISLKHAAMLAGLGKIGKNTLLINDRYGNMLWLNAMITSAELEPDPVAEYEGCIEGCDRCLKACPVNALDGALMDQRRCHEYAFGPENGGDWRIKCFRCRKVCPHCAGIR